MLPIPTPQAGHAQFPNDPSLFIASANFSLHVAQDGPAARTQLQIATKHLPSLIERYKIFVTLEDSKALKDSADGGMDLQAYVEFKRNYRAVLRVHRAALAARNAFWSQFTRSTVLMADVDKSLAQLEEANDRAYQVYKR